MSRVCLIVADSLRWDYASIEMWGELFDEATWTQIETPDTYTAVCMPTLLSGDPNHGNTDFLRRLAPSDSLTHNRDSVMWSHTFGNEKSMLKWGSEDEFDVRGFDDIDENEIVDWLDEYEAEEKTDDLPELIIYHSMITHFPFGASLNYTDNVEIVDGIYVDDQDNYEYSRSNYERGVTDMALRVKTITELLPNDYTIVLTSDHGEGLGENGTKRHINDIEADIEWVFDPEKVSEDASWSGVEKTPWLTQVPLVINDPDVSIGHYDKLRNVRGIVEALLDDIKCTPRQYVTDWEIDFLGDEYTDMESVMEQLEDLGYK